MNFTFHKSLLKKVATKLFLSTRNCVNILFAFALFLSLQHAFAQDLDRELQIELDLVKEAKYVEVKIIPMEGTKGKTLIEKITDSNFSKRLPLGTYKIQTRSIDRRGVAGSWSDLGTVPIQFKPPVLLEPKQSSSFKISSGTTLDINFRWESFHPLAKYSVEISDASGASIRKQEVTGSNVKISLPAGAFKWTVRSLPPTGVAVDGKDPEPQDLTLNGKALADPKIEVPTKKPPESFTWTSVNDATSYHVTLRKIKDEKDNSITPSTILSEQDIQTNSIPVPADLSPGTYQLSVIAQAVGFQSSRERFIRWRIREKKAAPTPATTPVAKTTKPAPEVRYTNPNLFAASIGPVFWKYQFVSEDPTNSFDLVAVTLTTFSADLNIWQSRKATSAWGFELRARQTNISLFPEGSTTISEQTPVTVSDRRIGLLARHRTVKDRVGFDVLLGFGTHHYTYLIQDGAMKVIAPESGELREFYLGGAIDWRLTTAHRSIFDLTFHPVSASQALSVKQTTQYTATLKFLQNVYHEKAFISYNLENFRSSVTLTSPLFTGSATTISNWYRFGLGLGMGF